MTVKEGTIIQERDGTLYGVWYVSPFVRGGGHTVTEVALSFELDKTGVPPTRSVWYILLPLQGQTVLPGKDDRVKRFRHWLTTNHLHGRLLRHGF